MESAKEAFCDEHMDATRRPLGKPSQSGMRRILCCLLLLELLLLLWIGMKSHPGPKRKVCFAVVVVVVETSFVFAPL